MTKIDDLTDGVRTIALSGHIKPDGDCTGSLLALYNYLELNYPEIKTDVFLEMPSERFRFLRNYDRIKTSAPEEGSSCYDLMIALDCSTKERLGDFSGIFTAAKHTVCIDHHISNAGYADENYILPYASSASEVLYGMLDDSKLDAGIATCLYVGIISDTGIFKYSCTTPETMRIAARLMEFGIDTNTVIDDSFSSRSWPETRIMGYVLENSQTAFDGKVIYSVLTSDIMQEFGVTTQDLEGIVAELRLVRGIECAFFIYQTGENEFKASFRSEAPFDANELASVFGGGGHIRASGCSVIGEAQTCVEAILLQIAQMKGRS